MNELNNLVENKEQYKTLKILIPERLNMSSESIDLFIQTILKLVPDGVMVIK